MQHGECQQFDLFPAVDRCPPSLPLSSTGHSFRIYTCHFSSVVNIYELHYCITECVAAVQLSQGAIDPHLRDAEPLSLGDRHRALVQTLCRALNWTQGSLSNAPAGVINISSSLLPADRSGCLLLLTSGQKRNCRVLCFSSNSSSEWSSPATTLPLQLIIKEA